LNEEQREVLINNYCGSVQVFLVMVGKNNLEYGLAKQIVQLVVVMFETFKKISTGPLLILNGLIATIED
jgi:dUTPase